MKQNRRRSLRFALHNKMVVFLYFGCLVLLSFVLAACSSSGNKSDAAGQAVVEYYQGLTSGNVDQMKSNSCAAWEEAAQLEFDAFAGVETRLDNLVCQSNGTEEEYTLIACTGGIIATYGNEDTDFDLSNFTFRTLQEAGEWRMCGY